MSSKSKVEFTPPEGFQVPEGKEGEEFDLVCSFKASSDGKLCMTKLGDMDMGYHEDSDHKPGYQKYSSEIMKGMSADVGMPGNS